MCRVITGLLIAGLAVAGPAVSASAQEVPLTLQAAIAQARVNSQQFRSAQAASQLAAEDRKQAFGALLPSLSEFSQYIYTQPNGTLSGVFVANDGPHVYTTQ